jgi:hypothetical protein
MPDWAREEYEARLAKEASRRTGTEREARLAGPRAAAGKKQRVRVR